MLTTTTTTMSFPLPLLLLYLIYLLPTSLSLNQQGLLLLDAKRSLSDPSGALADWNPRDATPCNWTGIRCSSSSAASVTAVDLPDAGLSGPFPSALCRLPSLSSLNLALNLLSSSLPDSSLLPCPALSYLDLSENLLVGPLPPALATLPSLLHLDLSGNNFSGPIPPSFARFPKLQVLSLTANLLSGPIPSFLSNLTSLRQLNLSYNPFSTAPLPPSFASLPNLEILWLSKCGLVGPIPPELGRLSDLTDLDLSANNLSGPVPAALTNLSSLVQLELYSNSLSGEFPSGFSRLPSLLRIDVSMNQLDGPIPADVFLAPLFESLHLYSNKLDGDIPDTIANASRLFDLRLFGNKLTGRLPTELGKNSPLLFVDLSGNLLSGSIPPGVCDRGTLQELLLIDNSFSGGIPDGLGRCRSLTRLRLAGNNLSGEVPPGIWGLPHVSLIDLTGNSLSGSISPAIAGAANLSKLLVADNRLTGSIPFEVGAALKLYEFSAANNQLTGPLPAALGELTELGQLDLRNNSLSGGLLRGIQSWTSLNELNLADNRFTGEIPPELGGLPVLNYLDLSGNLLTGEIPIQLQNLKLNQFNLSNNRLSGPLPPLYANEAYRASFVGNLGLCGDLNGLCASSGDGTGSHWGSVWLLRSIFVAAALVFVVGVAWFYWKYRSFKRAKLGLDRSKWILTSFHKLGFSEYEILDCLDEDNVIGSGASGKVYKAVLSNGEVVAVKKLWRSLKNDEVIGDRVAVDAFEAEVCTLGKIRHKNIVKLLCSCTHKDCKLLVYEYMPNGSLGDLLHSSKARILDWLTRYKIALDAAEGLSYLHHDCVPPIVHRDVKSNNILLDGVYGARVADFGVAKAIEAIGKGQKSMSVIAGSCGYIAPEYAYTLRVNEKSDIYSFGVVILELVTGKRPIDPEFGEKDLVKWVCSTSEQKGMDHVLDPKLDLCYKEEICKVLRIGIDCTSSLPINRPSMRRVVKMLLKLRTENKHKPEKKDGKLSPYYYEDTSEQASIV